MLHINGWIQDPEEPVMKLATMLVDITNRITAEVFREHEIFRLHDLIVNYLQYREKIIEDHPVLGTVKPKHHFLGKELISLVVTLKICQQ